MTQQEQEQFLKDFQELKREVHENNIMLTSLIRILSNNQVADFMKNVLANLVSQRLNPNSNGWQVYRSMVYPDWEI